MSPEEKEKEARRLIEDLHRLLDASPLASNPRFLAMGALSAVTSWLACRGLPLMQIFSVYTSHTRALASPEGQALVASDNASQVPRLWHAPHGRVGRVSPADQRQVRACRLHQEPPPFQRHRHPKGAVLAVVDHRQKP